MGKLGKSFLFLLTAMLLLTAVSRAAAAFTVAQVRVEQPQARKIVHTVTGDGTVEQMTELPVYTVPDILVAEIPVRQGQAVKKGDVLARLDPDSIRESIQELKDDIETLNLQNEALASQQQQADRSRSKSHRRAQEDHDSTLAQNRLEKEKAGKEIEKAEKQLEKAEKQLEKAENQLEKAAQQAADEARQASEDKQNELEQAADAAQKAYEDAKELANAEILLTKRALEDASKAPAADYDTELLQLEINQKQRTLNELYRQKQEGSEDPEALDEQIRSLEDTLAALRLQLMGMRSGDSRQEEERKQALQRAQEDYSNTVAKYDRIVSEAEQQWLDAGQALTDFLTDQEEPSAPADNPSVKAAEQELAAAEQQTEASRQALEDAKQHKLELASQQKEEARRAKRTLEDSAESGAKDTTADVNALLLAEKKRQLSLLQKELDNGGEIIAQTDETVTQILVTVGQRTPETAVFLMSDTSGGMLFTTQVRKEDAPYVAAGDAVTLKSAGKAYEELSVLSAETNEDESVTVTVYVPENTLALGAHADMELTRQSEEYSITVPLSAVHTENGKNYVYIMQPADTVLGGQYMASRTDVTIADKNGLYAAITESSLTSESPVIVRSDQIISEGETVRLQEE